MNFNVQLQNSYAFFSVTSNPAESLYAPPSRQPYMCKWINNTKISLRSIHFFTLYQRKPESLVCVAQILVHGKIWYANNDMHDMFNFYTGSKKIISTAHKSSGTAIQIR